MAEPVIHRPTWAELSAAAWDAVRLVASEHVDAVWGVPRGGCTPAALVARVLGVGMAEAPGPRVLVVDDIIESGATLDRIARQYGRPHVALYRKAHAPSWARAAVDLPSSTWVEFPWEHGDPPASDALVRLAQAAGITDDGLNARAVELLPSAIEIVRGLLRPPTDRSKP